MSNLSDEHLFLDEFNQRGPHLIREMSDLLKIDYGTTRKFIVGCVKICVDRTMNSYHKNILISNAIRHSL